MKRKLFFILFDIIIITISTFIAFNLRFDFNIPVRYDNSIYTTVAVLVLVRVALFNQFRIYNISWRHFGFKDITSLVYVTVFSTVLLVLIAYISRTSEFTIPRSIIAIEFFISFFMILALRVSKRLYLENYTSNANGKSTIIIASLDNANAILRTINTQESDYYPIAILNDLYRKRKVNGIEVYSFDEFMALGIECEVAIVDESIELPILYEKLKKLSLKSIKVARDFGEYATEIQDVSVEDLLARHTKDLDKGKIEEFYKVYAGAISRLYLKS